MNVYFFDKTIEAFIWSLEKSVIAKTLRTIDLLERFGSQLGMPHSKSLGKGMFELRIRGVIDVRLLYTFHIDSAVILYGFIKKTNRIPAKEISIAKVRKDKLDKI